MINTSFVRRQLRVVIQLYKGEFEDGGNTKTIEDLAMTCSIQKLAYPECGKASVEIAGMRLPDMEQLSTLAFDPLYVKNNQLTIYAGDEYHEFSQVFSGTITKAGADFNAAPDVKFKMEASVGYFGRMIAKGPTAINGTQKADAFIKGQMEQAGFTFQNQGLTPRFQTACSAVPRYSRLSSAPVKLAQTSSWTTARQSLCRQVRAGRARPSCSRRTPACSAIRQSRRTALSARPFLTLPSSSAR